VGKRKGKSPSGRAICRWEYNIKMDLSEIGGEDVDWIHFAKGRKRCRAGVNTVMKSDVHKKLEFSHPLRKCQVPKKE
jgi:hypothetical protein